MALPMVTQFFRRHKHFSVNGLKRRVRVRFAPSPTGMLHLGGLRTALFNYLYARAHQGTFILRVEDTDLTRKVPAAVEKIEEMLNWAGLPPDESPTIGGDFGPYMQSERLQLYKDNIETLLQKRLELLRKEAARRNEVPRYDNKCRDLTQEEVEEKMEKNIPHVIRFKYQPLTEPWHDLVYGLSHEGAVGETLEADFIVLKTDGYPTYHFANVVDDHFMEISHVLRGVEWSISTPKHLQMYAAFGWTPPQYAHLPLILNKDGTKLSKRQGDIDIGYFRSQHIEPEALLNYLTTVNKGFTDSTEGKTLQEMVQLFSLEQVNTHSSRLQPEKLLHLNRLHLHRQFNTDKRNTLVARTRQILKNHYSNRLPSHVIEEKYLESVISWALDHRISQLEELTNPKLEFLWLMPSAEKIQTTMKKHPNCYDLLLRTIALVNNMDNFKEAGLKDEFHNVCTQCGLTMKNYMGLLRRSLSDAKEGPSVAEMMLILGKMEVLKRLQLVVDSLEKTEHVDTKS